LASVSLETSLAFGFLLKNPRLGLVPTTVSFSETELEWDSVDMVSGASEQGQGQDATSPGRDRERTEERALNVTRLNYLSLKFDGCARMRRG
jgi:hypothetical protein